jgi:hypothetical protein
MSPIAGAGQHHIANRQLVVCLRVMALPRHAEQSQCNCVALRRVQLGLRTVGAIPEDHPVLAVAKIT